MKITLKAARVNQRLTQMEAAARIGVTKDTVSNWEREKSYPNAKDINKIVEVYKIDYDDIIFFTN